MTEKTILKFWIKVDKNGPMPNPNNYPEIKTNCWNWIGGKFRGGYGRVHVSRRTNLAHRVAWELVFGEIPKDLLCLHKCDNPSCVNPNHLFLGTQQDNINDMKKKGRDPIGIRHGASLHPEKMKRGEAHHNSKLTSENVVEIRKIMSQNHKSTLECASKFRVHRKTIQRIVRREIWRHVL